MDIKDLAGRVIGCGIEVHRELGPGLLESTYEQCLAWELADAGIPFRLQAELPVHYKNKKIDCGYRIDVLVDDRLILELKSVERLLPIHEAQLLTYMKLASIGKGIQMNFDLRMLEDGLPMKRLRALRVLRGE